jgi:mRNA interferase YafQ
MALTPQRVGQFKRDYKLMKRRGKDLSKLKDILERFTQGKPLDAKHRDHYLAGNFAGRRECHVEPDWLLIYKIEPGFIIFERTGTHSDLFG